MGETEIVIRASELSQMGVACQACGATITVDGTRPQWAAQRAACPACRAHLDRFEELLAAYRQFYVVVTADSMAVTFRLKGSNDDTKGSIARAAGIASR